MTEPLSTQYDPRAIEPELYRDWEANGYFEADAERVLEDGLEPYVIVIPPPNVTAMLHIGHGLNNTLQDVLIRWRRMQGYAALWQPGTDHAGIATQNVVERILSREGKTRFDLGREAFVARTWEFVNETGTTIIDQLRAIGSTCDWRRTRFTLEPALSTAVRETFVHLYEKGLIYRGNYIINWCPRCLTALSDEEAEPQETHGKIYHLRYPVQGGGFVTVATTRPETMLGDTAVAVNPKDERYTELVGKIVNLPLTGRTIPIIADDFVDAEFGSGAVKITPAHDPNDFEMGRRHDLPMPDIMTPEATINDNAPEAFRGLDRFEAREQVVQAFRELGLLERIEDHTHSLPHCYRCDTIVEPRLSDQWFVRMKPLAEPALAASRDGRIKFTPERWTKVYDGWLENIRDWCISRQLWWGHRIPVWYCQNPECRETIVSRTDPTTCTKCGSNNLEQDPDVLDTWFSSWLWPFSTLGWPDKTRDLEAFYPTSTLVSAYDIIFFWVARMIMAGLEFMGEVPYRNIYITGLVRDHFGRKMSKSLGNGIDPLDVVQLYGADALRFTLLQGSGVGTDMNLNHENLEEAFSPGRNFANKVWNAGRFALMNLGEEPIGTVESLRNDLELADRWILSRLSEATDEVTRALESFRFHDAANTVYHFFWGEVADWYLELIKPRFMPDAARESREAARATLAQVLDTVLRLLHPMMPFISDALWRRLPAPTDAQREASLVIAKWPESPAWWRNVAAEEQLGAVIELIGVIRTLRGEYGVPAGSFVPVVLTHSSDALSSALAEETRALRRLARVDRVDAHAAGGGAGAHAVLRGGTELFVPLEGIIDVVRERSRLNDELARLSGLLKATEGKLKNDQFRSKAPPEVVAKEEEKAESLRDQRDRLSRKITALT